MTASLQQMPALQKGSTGKTHITLVNLESNKPNTVIVSINVKSISGQILTATAFNAFNSFDKPKQVFNKPFTDFKWASKQLTASIPLKKVLSCRNCNNSNSFARPYQNRVAAIILYNYLKIVFTIFRGVLAIPIAITGTESTVSIFS